MPARLLVLYTVAVALLTACKDDPSPLRACFEIPGSVEHGTAVTFNAGCSTSAGSFHWYFGDGGEALTPDFSYTYPTPGNYKVKLVVENSGAKDSVTHEIQILPTVKESSCLPIGMRSPEIWPAKGSDSVSLKYQSDKKLSEMTWWVGYSPEPFYTNRIKFFYNEAGKPSKLEVYYSVTKIGDIKITYDERGLPSKALFISADETFAYFEARFDHNSNDQLSEIEYHQFGSINSVFYDYDGRGNAIKIRHKRGGDREEVERVNTAFLPSLVYYYNAPELRFYLEYIAMHGVYNNNVAEGHIYSVSDPGYGSITWFGDYTPDGPAWYSGFSFTGTDILDPETKLIRVFSAEGDIDRYHYNCF